MKNVLVTVDFDEKNILLLDKAMELAPKFGSKVWVMHIAAPDPDFVGYEAGPQYIRDDRAGVLRKEHKLIGEYIDKLKEKGIQAEGLLVQGATAETILDECIHLNIDLLIIGHHKHSLLHRTFAYSPVSSIIEKSAVPVLLVPLD